LQLREEQVDEEPLIPHSENPFHFNLLNQPRIYTETPVKPQETSPEEVKNLEKFVHEVQLE
jgi:hypothetical protein